MTRLLKLMRKNLLPYLCFILCLLSCIKEKQTGADFAIGDSIPDFSVSMNDGTAVSAEQLSKGTACPDCRQTLPVIQGLYNEYTPKGVQFVLISRQEGAESIAKYWQEQGYTMPYSAQEDRKVYELFAKTRVPRVYIIKNGIIKSIHTDDPIPTYDALAVLLTELVRSQNKFKVGNFPAFSFGVR